jgi:hypothetical protein
MSSMLVRLGEVEGMSDLVPEFGLIDHCDDSEAEQLT